MLLQIQPDESLGSYVLRTLFLNKYDETVGVFRTLASRPWLGKTEVNQIAESIGWPGCYGFNRLLHQHTDMASKFVIKHAVEASYSGKEYGGGGSCYANWGASFCPECVREDLYKLGFSYWRRLLGPSITVCHKHNTVLMDHCPFCSEPFDRRGHSLGVMWSKCGERHLGEAVSVPNTDPLALKRAKAFHGVSTSLHHISFEGAIQALHDKAEFVLSLTDGDRAAEIQSYLQRLGHFLTHVRDSSGKNDAFIFDQHKHWVIEAAAALYESIDDFVVDANLNEQPVRAINSLWSTYQAGGNETAEYVEEDYYLGVGRWFRPYPNPRSEHDRSGDGYDRRRPKVFPCCNFPYIKGKGQRLSSVVVKPLPGIPFSPVYAAELGLWTSTPGLQV